MAGSPVTRDVLREELAALWGDFERTINDLEHRIARQGNYHSEAEFPDEVVKVATKREPIHQPDAFPKPHQWVQRHIRSYAVAAEMADTHQGLNEQGRLSPVTIQAPHKHLKGHGPLAKAIRKASTFADVTDRRRQARPKRKPSDLNSEITSFHSARAPGFVQQAWDAVSMTVRRGGSQLSSTSEVSESVSVSAERVTGASIVQMGHMRSEERAESNTSKYSRRSKCTTEGGGLVGDTMSSHPVLPNDSSQILPVDEDEEEREDSEFQPSARRRRFSGALSSIIESTTTLAAATKGSLPVPEAQWWFPFFCQRVVHNVLFEYLVLLGVLANAATIGIVTDHMARHMLDKEPDGFRKVDMMFTVFFLAELVMRIVSDGCWFFTGPAKIWNCLDGAIVGIQLVEEVFALLKRETGMPFAISLMRVLRLLRLVRVIRVMRLLRYITELRTIVTSLTSSMKPLLSSMLLMFLVVYIVGIYLTQLVLNHRLSLNCDMARTGVPSGDCGGVVHLEDNFGDVGSAVLALFQAVTGGVDWGDILRPLMREISPFMGVLFSFYVVFTSLALMNIVTGVFVETSVARAREDRDLYMINHLRDLFLCLDLNHNGIISWNELEEHLDNPKLQTFLKEIDLDVSEASGLFRLLDRDQSGMIDADEFLSGCVRLRGPAKALDLQLVMRELAEQHNMILGISSALHHEKYRERAPPSTSFTSAPSGNNGSPLPIPPPKAMRRSVQLPQGERPLADGTISPGRIDC